MFHCNDERPQLIRIACMILVECTCTYMYFTVTLTTIVRDTTASADDRTVLALLTDCSISLLYFMSYIGALLLLLKLEISQNSLQVICLLLLCKAKCEL
jgi:hypothetical protein